MSQGNASGPATFPYKTILACVAVVSLAAAFLLLASELREGETLAFDHAVLQALRSTGPDLQPIGPAWFREGARDITALGSFTLLVPLVALVAAYLHLEGKTRNALSLLIASGSGALLSSLLKIVFDRPRPEMGGAVQVFTSSFPSGHALSSAVIYLTVGTFIARASQIRGVKRLSMAVAMLLTLIVGLSRIYLGVHYPTDVLAGWMLGIGWAIVCSLAADWLFPS